MTCECCQREKEVISVSIGNGSFKMAICRLCLKKIQKYHIPDDQLRLIHNYYKAGTRRKFL